MPQTSEVAVLKRTGLAAPAQTPPLRDAIDTQHGAWLTPK